MTEASKDIPKSVQWVLDFLNIHCKQGEFNSWRLPLTKRELKRPPLLESHIKKSPESKDREVVDKTTGYVWVAKINGAKKVEYIFSGKQSVPTLADFKNFFLNAGIPPIKGNKLLLENGKPLESLNTEVERPKNWFKPGYYNPPFEVKLYSQLLSIWSELSRILSIISAENYNTKYDILKSFIANISEQYTKCMNDDEIPLLQGQSATLASASKGEIFLHYGMLPQALYACILDFGINHKELHSLLRQCKCCGSFWIKNDKKRFFCSSVCSQRSDDQTREVNKEASTKSKKHKRKNDKNKIMNVLKRKHGEDAEKYYKQEIEGKISSYKDFVRRSGKFYNLRR